MASACEAAMRILLFLLTIFLSVVLPVILLFAGIIVLTRLWGGDRT